MQWLEAASRLQPSAYAGGPTYSGLAECSSPSPCTGLRSPRLSQPGPYHSSCPCTQPLADRLSRSRRSVLPRLLKNQAGASSSWVRAVCWPQHAATSSPRECPYSSIATSRQPPSWAGVSRLPSSALRPAAAIDMPKSPSKRERERSRPGRLNRTFTDKDQGLAGSLESTAPKAAAAKDDRPLLKSQQERRWHQTPPPLTVYSEVYYHHGKPPQPSPALDRILQELLEQQEPGPTTSSRPRITLKSRDINRRRAKAEIIAKRLEARDGRPPRPLFLPPRPCLPPRRRSRSRPRHRPCSIASSSEPCSHSSNFSREQDTEAPRRPTQKPTPKRCPLPPPGKAEHPVEDKPPTSCQDQQPPPRPGPQDSEYTYYSSEEEGTTGQAKLPDYPAGSLISRLLPTSTTAAVPSESGSYESSRGPRSVTIHLSRIHRSVHALPVAAACSDAVTPLLRQHREQAALADRPRQAGLRRSFSVSCPLHSNPLCLAAPSWVHRGTETWSAPVCIDASLSAVKSAEGISAALLSCCDRPLLSTAALGPAAGPMAPPTVQPHDQQSRRRPRTSHPSCADAACPWQFTCQTRRLGTSKDPASTATWLTGIQVFSAAARLHLADRGSAQELRADTMDIDEKKHPGPSRPRPVNPRFLTGLSSARRHEPVFAGEVRSRGPPLTRFHPGLAASLPDELFEGLIPGPDTGRTRRTTVATTSTTRTQATPIIEVEDDSPRSGNRASDAEAQAPVGPSEGTSPPQLAAEVRAPEGQLGQLETAPAPRGGRRLSLQRATTTRPIDLEDDPPPKHCQEKLQRPTRRTKQHRPTCRRPWKVHALGKTLLPRWRQAWRSGFQRAYRTVHCARSGFIIDVPSLLWLARRYHLYYPRSQWPNIHAALQRLTGTPGLESLRAALTPLETRHRRGRNKPCPPLHRLCNPNCYGFETPMPLNTVADVSLSGWTLLSSTAALAAPRRRGFSWYAPQTAYPSTFLPASARLVRTSVSPASFGRNYRLAYLLTTLALSTEPEQQPGAWRDGFRHPRRDLSLYRSVCTTGHRDGLKSTKKSRRPSALSAAASHAAAVHCTQRRRAIPSLNAQVLHPSKQDICPRRPCSMRGQRPPSVRTHGRKALASRGHSLPLMLSRSSYPHRPVPYADCTTSSSLVSLPCSAHLGNSPRRAGLGTWTLWIDSRSYPHNGATGQEQGGYHRTPTWKGLDLGCRTRPRPWVRRLPSRGTSRRNALRRGKREAGPHVAFSRPSASCCPKSLLLFLSAAASLLSLPVTPYQQQSCSSPQLLNPPGPLLSLDYSTQTSISTHRSFASTHRSPPGPKSGGHPRRPIHLIPCRTILRFALLSTQLWGLAGVRVGEIVANSPEVASPALQRPHSAAKPRAPVLTDYNDQPGLAGTITRVQKRSYARFLRRLSTYGTAVYKGQTYTRPLGPAAGSHASPQDPGPTHGAAPQSHRWRIVSWNAGGLSQPKLDELFLWLQMEELQGRPVHVMTIQETHWSFTSEWQSQGHWLIHSSLEKPARSAGVLQILRQDFVSSQQIRTAHVIPGRLVHTRLATEPPISLITVYQHCWSTNSAHTPTQDKLLEVREQLWTQLHRLVGNVAQRHQLVIAGDFNTPCLAIEDRPSLVRAATGLDRGAPTQKDHGRLQSLLRDHSLTAVSSFGRATAAATYLSGSGPKTIKTRIDFILCRAHQSDRITKTARPLAHVPFVPRHLPLNATMPWPHRRLLPRSTPGQKKKWTLTAINTALQQCPELSQKFSHVAKCRLQLHPYRTEDDPCDHLNAQLTKAWEDVVDTLGLKPGHMTPAVGVPSLPEASIKSLWHLKRLLQQQPTTTFAQRSQALHLRQSVRNLQQELRKRSRQRKQERVDAILHQAESVASPSSLYKAVRLLAPKQRHCRIQLRDEEGQLMSPTGELRAITAHFRSIYERRTNDLQAPAPQAALSFDSLEVQHALASLPSSKALPPEYAPASLWKLAAEPAGACLAQGLADSLRPPHYALPSKWHKVHVCLIPKVAMARTPKQLRPICLLPPKSKVLAMMLADRIRERAEAYIRRYPQFAYITHRSTDDAISRVCSHLAEARRAASDALPNAHRRKAGDTPKPIAGGLSLSLDVDKAFDSLPRDQLVLAMQDAALTSDEIALAVHIHEEARLHFQISDQAADLPLQQGVRQGCGLSPLLWSLATSRLCKVYLATTQTRREPAGEPTLYADDIWTSWMVHSQEQLRSSLRAAGTLIQILEEAGLRVSPTKTVMLYALQGTAARSTLKAKLTKLDTGEPALKIRVGSRTFPVKVVPAHHYLGAKVSYAGHELANLQHRLDLGWQTYWRLSKVLRNRALTLASKLRIWRTCVLPVMTYSLAITGIPVQARILVTQFVHKQLRLILKLPAHITKIPSHELCQRSQVQDPLRLLEQMTQRHLQKTPCFPSPALEAWHDQLVEYWTEPAPHPRQEADAPVPSGHPHTSSSQIRVHLVSASSASSFRPLHCPVCGVSFPSLQAVRLHISKTHQLQVRQSKPADTPAPELEPQTAPTKPLDTASATAKVCEPKRLYHVPSPEQIVPFPADEHGRFVWLHGRDGLSQCRHCLRKCNTWYDLRVHITTKACSVLAPDGYTELPAKLNLNPRPLFHQPDLQVMLTEDWEQIASWIKLHRPQAQHHCPLCHQWLLQPRGLRAHIKAKHAPLYVHCAEAVQRMQDHRRLLALGKTCRYCLLQLSGAPIKHATECSVLFLVHFLKAARAAIAPPQVPHSRPALPAADDDPPARADQSGGPSRSHQGIGCHQCADETGRAEKDDGGHSIGQSIDVDEPGPSTGKRAGARSHAYAGRQQLGQQPGGTPGQMASRELQRPPQPGQGQRPLGPGISDGACSSADATQTAGTSSTDRQATTPAATTILGTPGIRAFFRVRDPASPVNVPHHGTPPHEARRCPLGAPAVHHMGPLPHDTATSHDPPGALQCGTSLVRPQAEQPGVPCSPHAHHPLAEAHVDARTAGPKSTGRSGSPITGGGPRSVRPQPWLQIPEMGQQGGDHEADSRQGPSSSQEDRGDRQGDVGVEHPSSAPQPIPCHAAAAGTDGRSHGHVAPGSRVERRGHGQVLGAPSATLPQLGFADAGVHTPTGSPPTVSTGPAAAVPSQLPAHPVPETAAGLLALLPRLRLSNPSNYCYSHACLLAYLWLVGKSSMPIQVLGREPIKSFLKQAQSRPRLHLWSLLPWRQAMRTWRNPARQQDAADYLLHLHQVLNASCFQGLWQSYDDSRHLRDEGGVCPLILSGIHDTTDESIPLITVQEHVQRWHNQHHKHALIAGTDVVALQLSRFSNARGIATKLHHRIKAEPDILLPQWTSTGILWRTYQLQAMIQHIGDHATTGHYRAALQPVASSGPTDSWFHTDDDQEAQRVHITALETTSYILFYKVRWTEDSTAHSGP